jgi:hypothetical protein
MCFELDSTPPIPVLSGAAVSHRDLELEAADGNRFAAFFAEPEEATGRGVVILPDVRGLYRFYEELALRFAERGIAAVAIDYFGRTAGVGKRDEDFSYSEHVDQTRQDGIQADTRAAAEYLRSPEGGSPVDLHGRLLLRRPQLVAGGDGRARARGSDRVLREARRRSRRVARPGRPGTGDRDADPRPDGWCRRGDPARRRAVV